MSDPLYLELRLSLQEAPGWTMEVESSTCLSSKVHLFLELAGSPSSPREGKTHPSLHQGQGRLASESRMRVPTTSRFGWTLGKRVTIFCHLQDTWRKYNAQWYGIKPDKKINLLFQPFLNNTSLVSPGLGCDEKQHHTP